MEADRALLEQTLGVLIDTSRTNHVAVQLGQLVLAKSRGGLLAHCLCGGHVGGAA